MVLEFGVGSFLLPGLGSGLPSGETGSLAVIEIHESIQTLNFYCSKNVAIYQTVLTEVPFC